MSSCEISKSSFILIPRVVLLINVASSSSSIDEEESNVDPSESSSLPFELSSLASESASLASKLASELASLYKNIGLFFHHQDLLWYNFVYSSLIKYMPCLRSCLNDIPPV